MNAKGVRRGRGTYALPRVKVEPLGDLWKVMKKNEYLQLKDNANVYDLIKTIDAQYATKIWESSIDMDTMDLYENAVIFVNGHPVRGKLNVPLNNGDSILIVPGVGCC